MLRSRKIIFPSQFLEEKYMEVSRLTIIIEKISQETVDMVDKNLLQSGELIMKIELWKVNCLFSKYCAGRFKE